MKMKWTVITGACGGLGQAFCTVYAKQGCSLWLTGRSEEKLLKLKDQLMKKYQIDVRIEVCDLSDLHQTNNLCEHLKTECVERLVNNAGIGEYGLFEQSDLSKLIQMNQVNMTSLMMLSHAVLAMMKKQGGELLNVASTAAFQPGEMMAVYYASKAYVLSLTEALHMEAKGTKAKVSALCCGPIETGFACSAGFKHTKMQRLLMIFSNDAAEIAAKQLSQGKRCIIPGTMNKIVLLISSVVPKSLKLFLLGKMQKKRKLNKSSQEVQMKDVC